MVTEKDERDYAQAGNVLDILGCDDTKAGFYDFVELVYKIRLKIRKEPQYVPTTGDIVYEMCKTRKQHQRGFYANIRKVIKPLLDADEAFFLSLGRKKPEKMTVGEVAKYLAYVFEK